MNSKVKIFLIEDNEGDIVLTIQAFKNADISGGINVARDGEEAMRYLRKEGKYAGAETPDLILLDINMPKLDGHEVLAALKKDETLRTIPVVMLTTSNSEKDIIQSYYNHANCYITKPQEFEKFIEVVQMIKDFWVTTVKLPEHLNYKPVTFLYPKNDICTTK